MTKKNEENRLWKKLDDAFGDVCTYSEYMCAEDLETIKESDNPFLADYSDEEIKKYWGLVRHGVGITASVFLSLIIDKNGKISAEELDKILAKVEEISTEE